MCAPVFRSVVAPLVGWSGRGRLERHSEIFEPLRCLGKLGHALRQTRRIKGHGVCMNCPGLVRTRFYLAQERDGALEVSECSVPIRIGHARYDDGPVESDGGLA